jgi:hypothetical protein
MFSNNSKPISFQELEKKRDSKDWKGFWEHIYNVLKREEAKRLERKELAKKKIKR